MAWKHSAADTSTPGSLLEAAFRNGTEKAVVVPARIFLAAAA